MLLAGPGTGKTTRIKGIVDDEFAEARRILVISFTNATVRDLTASFASQPEVDCYTLHSYALKINHLTGYYILDNKQEKPSLEKWADKLQVDFGFLCHQLQCITFDAMIMGCLSFLKTNPVYGQEQIGTLDLLIVDEYQDFNAQERDLIDAISVYATETIILGDDDQSIYGFKDADPDGILKLHARADVEKIKNENKCYRCPDAVVDCATKLIKHNKNRIAKPWWKTNRSGSCTPKQFLTQIQNNEFIASEIERIKGEDRARGEDDSTSILVLSPVKFYMNELGTLLSERGIDYVDFWTTTVDIDEYMRVWWLRAIFSERKLLNLIFLSGQLTQHYRRKLRRLLHTALQKDFDHDKVLKSIKHMYDAALIAYLDSPPAITEFVHANPRFAELAQRIDVADLGDSLDRILKDINPAKEFKQGSVNIMSIHKSKGLQADIVFVSNLVNGVIPNEKKGVDTMEAQRRLLFVGMTRALKCLYLLSSVEWDSSYVHKVDKSQFIYSWRKKKYVARTSQFVDEIM